MGDISTNFNRSEFACKCGKCGRIAVDKELLYLLEDLRFYFNQPVTITSGNRCESHNKAVGGKPASQHMNSIAADLTIKSIPTDRIVKYLDKKYPDKYGIGLYPGWVHIDVRPEKARW